LYCFYHTFIVFDRNTINYLKIKLKNFILEANFASLAGNLGYNRKLNPPLIIQNNHGAPAYLKYE